jgi:hypothetical protein
MIILTIAGIIIGVSILLGIIGVIGEAIADMGAEPWYWIGGFILLFILFH